jgi:hypothetical protein
MNCGIYAASTSQICLIGPGWYAVLLILARMTPPRVPASTAIRRIISPFSINKKTPVFGSGAQRSFSYIRKLARSLMRPTRHSCPLKGEGGRAPRGEVMVRRACIHNLSMQIKSKGRLQRWLQKINL